MLSWIMCSLIILNHGLHAASCVQALLKLWQSPVLCMGCCAGFFFFFLIRKLGMTVQVTINSAWLYMKPKQLQTFTYVSLELTSVIAASALRGGGRLVKCQPLQACQPSTLLVGLLTREELCQPAPCRRLLSLKDDFWGYILISFMYD